MDFHQVLNIPYGADEGAIKRAYSALIKQYRPDSHPAEFVRIREAYEAALRHSKSLALMEEKTNSGGVSPIEAPSADTSSPQADTTPVAETSADQEFERVLMKPPELQSLHGHSAESDAAAGNGFPGQHEFDRVLMEPPVLQPVDTPPRESLSPSTAGLSDAEVASLIFREFLGHDKAGEEVQAQRFRAHTLRLAELPLDVPQIEYENLLYSWMVASDSFPLFVFREASLRFDWESSEKGQDPRFVQLSKLAQTFAEAHTNRNPFLLLEGKASPRACRVTDHRIALRAKELSTAWQLACNQAGLPVLAPRLVYTDGRFWQLYWADIGVGLFAAWIAWLVLSDSPTLLEWLEVPLIGTAFALGSASLRGVALRARAGYRALASRFKTWCEILAEKWDVEVHRLRGIIVFILFAIGFSLVITVWDFFALIGFVMMGFVIWYLYGAMVKLETFAIGLALPLRRLGVRAWGVLRPGKQ